MKDAKLYEFSFQSAILDLANGMGKRGFTLKEIIGQLKNVIKLLKT